MSNLIQLSKEELLNHAKHLAAEDHRISLQLVECLRECERRMLYSELGYGSLWQFAVEHLYLSESSAYLRISTMRLIRENPKVISSLESGKLSLSNASQLHSFFRSEKKQGKAHSDQDREKIIESVTGLSKKECERTLLTLAPESLPQERERIISENKTELKLIVDQALMEKLKRLQEHLAHRLPQATYGELLEYLAAEALDRLEKKKRGSDKAEKILSQPSLRPDEVKSPEHPGIIEPALVLDSLEESSMKDMENGIHESPSRSGKSRPYISVVTRRTLWKRAQGQCERVSEEGTRCSSRYKLEIDHINPLATQGSNDISNLRYTCRQCNLYEAQKKLGSRLMKNYAPFLG